MELLLSAYGLLALLIASVMSLWFVVSLVAKRSDVADVAWGFGFLLVAIATFSAGDFAFDRGFLISFLVALWAIRLSAHIFFRNRKKGEDARYAKWRTEWGAWFPLRAFFQIFILQGALLLVVSAPVVVANLFRGGAWTPLDLLGVLLWLVGFFFEAVGDFQLVKFLRHSENRGHVLKTGLWRYTRHPNYFGEVAMWWGIFLIALSAPFGWVGVVGPLMITALILFVSGIPMLERSMAGNPEFEDYKKKTSVFFPWFPKE